MVVYFNNVSGLTMLHLMVYIIVSKCNFLFVSASSDQIKLFEDLKTCKNLVKCIQLIINKDSPANKMR